jgi:hypothetical protein
VTSYDSCVQVGGLEPIDESDYSEEEEKVRVVVRFLVGHPDSFFGLSQAKNPVIFPFASLH